MLHLLTIPPEQRDIRWIKQFFEQVPEAYFYGDPELGFEGPDGFFYLGLFSEPRSEAPNRIRLIDLIPSLTDQGSGPGCGVVINPHLPVPDWIFTYGHLWSFRQFRSFDCGVEEAADEDDESPDDAGAEERGVLVGSPTEEYLPNYVRTAIKTFLNRNLGLENVGVLLFEDELSTPKESLVFSLFREDFASDDQFDAVNLMLDWHLPPHYGLRAIPKDSEVSELFVPI